MVALVCSLWFVFNACNHKHKSVFGVKEGLCVCLDVAVHYRLDRMRSILCIHTLQSIAIMFALYFSQSLLLYPQLQLMTTTTAERSTYGTFSSTLLLHTKIKTPAINKPLRIIWHWLFYYFVSSSALLFYPLFSLHPKHSYLDRETSLILKSIAGKPSHLLTKVTSSYTHFFRVFLLSVHTAPLFCFACV